MTYTIGASHGPFTGLGSFVISKPAGIRTVLSGIPSWAARDTSSPVRYFRLGRYTLGNVDGFQNSVPIEYAQQVAYPIAQDWELLAYDIRDGASCLFQELVGAANVSTLNPWDRTPLPVSRNIVTGANAGTNTTTGWTYTVPTGRRLWIAKLECTVRRLTVSTSVSRSECYVTLGSDILVFASLIGGAQGAFDSSDMRSGPLILNAGQTITGYYTNLDGNGSTAISSVMNGFIFDA